MITGLGGTPIFYGVVENRIDPLKLGRVQVRIYGLHTDIKIGNDSTGEGIPTEDLPWAMPMQPITSAAMNGIGDAPTGLVEGTNVIGITRDGRFMNDLIILGSVGGIPNTAPNSEIGFNDPRKSGIVQDNDNTVNTYPKDNHLNEPDTHRLARNENIEGTIHQKKVDSVEADIPIANNEDTIWSEPKPPYAAEYPYNHVKESESGHIEEWDDTNGAERLHKYHRTGTFEEIHPDGSRVTKIVGDDYEICHKGKNLLVKGNVHVTVDGDAKLYVKGNVEEQVDKNVNRIITGNVTETIKGSLTRIVEGDVTENFESDKILTVTGEDTATVQGTKNTTVTGAINTTASQDVTVTGSKIHLNE